MSLREASLRESLLSTLSRSGSHRSARSQTFPTSPTSPLSPRRLRRTDSHRSLASVASSATRQWDLPEDVDAVMSERRSDMKTAYTVVVTHIKPRVASEGLRRMWNEETWDFDNESAHLASSALKFVRRIESETMREQVELLDALRRVRERLHEMLSVDGRPARAALEGGPHHDAWNPDLPPSKEFSESADTEGDGGEGSTDAPL